MKKIFQNFILLNKIFTFKDKKLLYSRGIYTFLEETSKILYTLVSLPILALIFQPDKIEILLKFNHSFFTPSSYFYFYTSNALLSFMILIALSLVILFSVLSILFQYLGNKVQYTLSKKYIQNLFEYYMKESYEYYIQNTPIKLKHHIDIVESFILDFPVNIINTLAFIVILLISITLVLIQATQESIFILIFILIIVIIFLKITQKGNQKVRKQLVNKLGNLDRNIYQPIYNFMDIYIYNKLLKYTTLIKNDNAAIQRHLIKSKLMELSFKPVIETSMLVSILAASLILLSTQSVENIKQLLASFVIYVAIAYRLIPVVSKIIHNLQLAEEGNAYFNKIKLSLLKNVQNNKHAQKESLEPFLSFEKSISLKNISYQYKGTKIQSLKNISLDIKKGNRIGIVGQSGSGKSTLSKIIMGLLTPQDGKVLIDQKYTLSRRTTQKNIWIKKFSYVSQDFFFYNTSIAENITFSKDFDHKRLIDILKQVDLYEYIQSQPKGIDSNITHLGFKLSGGQKQRLSMARALYCNPQIIIFDEASSSLDFLIEKKIIKSIYSLPKTCTIIIITHKTHTIKNCDQIYTMKDGQIYSNGTYEQLKKSCNLFQSLIG